MIETFVYNNTEVKKTGRRAIRSSNRANSTIRATEDVLYEVTPVDVEQGGWKKWVRDHELYQIKDLPTALNEKQIKDNKNDIIS